MQPVIAAVIVTYNPPGDFLARLKAAAAEVSHVIIIDNASSPPERAMIAQAQQACGERVECVWNPKNAGLAAALNQGIKLGLAKKSEWILLLDHDSQPVGGMVKKMLEAYAADPHPETVALVAPNIRDRHTNVATRYLALDGKFGFRRMALDASVNDEAVVVITSGSLIKARTFAQLGTMSETFFIDYIDYDFCLRIKKRGLRILLVRDAVLLHALGEKTTHRLAGMDIVAAHHGSFRYFYIFRNRLWTWKCYGRQFPGFVAHDALAAGLDIFRIIAYEKNKLKKLGAMAKGVAAGIVSTGGK